MKIITPLVKPKSVSQQIISQVTPVSTPEMTRKEKIPQETPPPQGPSLLNKENDGEDNVSISSDKETIIGESNFIQRTDSPLIVNMEPSGWDSSQSQGDESPSTRHKLPGLFAYHVPVVQAVPSKASPKVMSYPHNPVQERKTSTGRQSPKLQYSAYSNLESENKMKASFVKSMTLPVLPVKDYPKLDDYASSSSDVEEEEEPDEKASAFALALRQRKQKMARDSIAGKPRGRSNTVPDKGSPLIVRKMANQPDLNDSDGDEDTLSPIQAQILRASRARNERVNSNQPRMKPVDNKAEQTANSLHRNPLAKAMSLKIDSIAYYDSEDSGQEDEYSFSPTASPVKSYLKSRPVQPRADQPKAPPPTTKPKPQKKPPNKSSEEELVTAATASVTESSTDEMTDHHSKDNFRDEETKQGSGGMDWRSVLKPASERVSPQISDRKLSSKSNSDKLMPPPVQAKPSPEIRPKTLSKAVPSQDSTDFELPPPLPASNARPSSFVDVAPPDGFILEGVEIGESSTDDIIPPPIASPPTMITTPPPASPTLPPPLPDTSPPPQLTTGSSGVFIFPEMIETLSSSPKESVSLLSNNPLPTTSPIKIPVVNNVDCLPSPMPSPPSHTDTLEELNLSGTVVPPPEFGHSLPDEVANKQRPISPWSPESDISDTPPPLPSEPPPLDLDTSFETKVDVNELPDQPITPSTSVPISEASVEAGPAPTIHLQPESLGFETTSSLAQSNTLQLDSPPPRPPLPNYSLPSIPQKESSPVVDREIIHDGELAKSQLLFESR